jgi:hypothetical protein
MGKNTGIISTLRGAALAAGACLAAGAALAPAAALAGPCAGDIAELSRTLSASPALGGTPTTGALSGAGPGNAPSPGAGGSGSATPSPDRTAGTTADSRQGGTAGTREMNAAVGNQIATSPEDVRRQQQGLPTAAAAAESGQRAQSDRQRVEVAPGAPGGSVSDDRASRAKSELETARALDARDDGACRDAVTRVRRAMQGG